MKHRNLLTNIFSVVLIVSLIAFLFVTIRGMEGGLGDTIRYISLPLAIISVACIDIVFPILDNKQRLRENNNLKILTIVKIVLFIASFVVIGLYVTNIILNDDTEMVAVAVFVVLYFAQFFINIDPKQPRVSEVSDDEEYDVEEYDEDDDTDAEYEETGSEQDE
ncbi:MAG TPA: hypothetical protein PLI11_01780 [Clostridia bacterium]|jgi:quinol-cytochrome oxidoreductase complex cytochrome b subunit|nr:hypothetical protein [Clostridiaceae bacterium]HOA31424.1 hypothetical protein [Clostridia bacterium]HPZ51623.1 hypothetical protein [Clostridia bacterium]